VIFERENAYNYPSATREDEHKIIEEISSRNLLCPKAGTATSSPVLTTASQSNMNIINVMLWMKRNACEDSIIRKVAKLLKHLKQQCNVAEPEEVKLYIPSRRIDMESAVLLDMTKNVERQKKNFLTF
jgi:hypothetical protein